MKCLFATVLWGNSYVDEFLSYSLPSQLSPANLPGFPWLEKSTYLFLTTEADWARLEASQTFQHLQSIMDTRFLSIERIQASDKYTRASLAQLEAIRRSLEYDTVFFVYPDFVCADGVLTNVGKRMAEGYEAVMCPVPAVVFDLFEDDAVREKNMWQADGSFLVAPWDLAGLAYRHPHPMLKGYSLGKKLRNISPAYVLWDIPGHGWLLRCFHLHPFAIKVQRDNPSYLRRFDVSLDEEYVPHLLKELDTIYFPKDSNEFATCSLRQPMSVPQPYPGTLRLTDLAYFGERSAALIQREFLNVPFRWHYSKITSSARVVWEECENSSQNLMDIVQERLRVPDQVLWFEDPMGYLHRHLRRRRFRTWKKPSYTSAIPFPPPAGIGVDGDILTSSRNVRRRYHPLLIALLFLKNRLGLYRLRRFRWLLKSWMQVRQFLSR